MSIRVFAVAFLCGLIAPVAAFASPFGGQASQVVPCVNTAIYALVGSPDGGTFVWTPATITYQFGPPTHAGQWLLGLSGIPYVCIVSFDPLITWGATNIVMMGSSR